VPGGTTGIHPVGGSGISDPSLIGGCTGTSPSGVGTGEVVVVLAGGSVGGGADVEGAFGGGSVPGG
jgi:hypothetical protein